MSEKRSASGRRIPQEKYLVLDFDGTITKQDTISTLVTSAIKSQRESTTPPHPTSAPDLDSVWQDIKIAYFRDYEAHISSYSPAASHRINIDHEVEFLRSLAEVDHKSRERVRQSGVFRGLRDVDLEEAGRRAVRSGEVVVREGVKSVVEGAKSQGWDVLVVSVNWSRAFIRGVLDESLGNVDDNLRVVANDVGGEHGDIRGPGLDEGRVLATSGDKLVALRHTLQVHTSEGPADQEKRDIAVVYFGDSTTDLECLLYDRGIVLDGSDGVCGLRETLERVGVEVAHVSDHRGNGSGKVVWTKGFEDVLESGILDTWVERIPQ